MILTGTEIVEQLEQGSISIVPFTKDQLNPNSYNYRLGDELYECSSSNDEFPEFKLVPFDNTGCTLEPGKLYLGHTFESIGSSRFSMSLIGRSSIGRLGLFVQLSANLGHRGSQHQWTLELFPTYPLRVYPKMLLGQVSFWQNIGEHRQYHFTYAAMSGARKSFGILK